MEREGERERENNLENIKRSNRQKGITKYKKKEKKMSAWCRL
jgi:hypothetical protein